MAIVGRAKYTRARESSRRRDAKGALRFASPRTFARARVYFARPTIAIAKIRDHSQSMGCKPNITPKRVLECGLHADDASPKTVDEEDSPSGQANQDSDEE